jgi:serine protease AprX
VRAGFFYRKIFHKNAGTRLFVYFYTRKYPFPMKKLLLLLIAVLACTMLQAQFSRYIIQLKDKNGTPFSFSNPGAYLSQKAIERRSRYTIPIDSTDLPLTPRYLDSIRAVPNVTVYNVSKWLNQVLIQTNDPNALVKINSFPFVKKSDPIAVRTAIGNLPPTEDKFIAESIQPIDPNNLVTGRNTTADFYSYGNAYRQVHIHEGEFLHNKGYRGDGMTIAVMDAGFFQYNTNPLLDSARLGGQLLGTWDFVARELSVTEDNAHGMQVLSVMAANKTGAFVGTSPKAKFWLFRTEDVGSEYPVEEQHWAAAAELADSLGVDMITSSLGYTSFDHAPFNYSHAQRNGNTAISTRAADFAAKKGILVTVSAGNSGNAGGEAKFISCPSDADSVMSIAACDVNGNIAAFSSWGPNGAGKTKPNITSVGQGTVISSTSGTPIFGNGTSFSNPNITGLIACLWQAFPEFSNMEIINAVQKSAHKANAPDDRFGFGIPNFKKAFDYLTEQRAIKNIGKILGDDWLKVFPVPFETQFKVALKAQKTGTNISFRLLDAAGRLLYNKTLVTVKGELYIVDFNTLPALGRGAYYLEYHDGNTRRTVKLVH